MTNSKRKWLFDPSSLVWRVNRESVLLLGGRRALLMQLAHPLVSQAVADHSRFIDDRVGRLLKTLQLSFAIVFGETDEAEAAVDRINAVHRSVVGALDERAGPFDAGTIYRADDPELLLWVHATLVDSALVFYERFVRRLSSQERETFYSETGRFTRQLGIPPELLPGGYDDFVDYIESMIKSGRITVTATARRLAEEILYPPVGWIPRRLFDPLNVITIGTLPPPVREGYGLRWNRARGAALGAATAMIRGAVTVAPKRLRFVPPARRAEERSRVALSEEKPL